MRKFLFILVGVILLIVSSVLGFGKWLGNGLPLSSNHLINPEKTELGVKKEIADIETESAEEGYGNTPFIDPHANPQVESSVEALETGTHPERLSVLMYSEEAFDLDAYQLDPTVYLDIAEPGRAFQPAQPGPGIPHLQPMAPPFQEVVQGKSVSLSVRGVPNSPVTFTSTDLGIFENQLTTITVDSGEEGIAKVELFGTPGTIEDVNILVASPVTSGQVKYIVNVKLPEEPGI